MIPLFDLHTHTDFSDGANTPEEMVEAALKGGMTCLGISDHGYAPYDTDCCMTEPDGKAYRAAIAGLREKYAGRLRILCGVEQDFWSEADPSPYAYVIGSVHYVKAGGAYLCVDNTPEIVDAAIRTHFGGDAYAFCEAYFLTVAQVVEQTGCDIIGHFDLVSKFVEKHPLFDETHPRYVSAWRAALDRLLPCGKPFEVNTGAMSRLWRTSPYPSAEMIAYIRERGGRLLLTSDSHSAQTLRYAFEQYADELGDSLIRSPDELDFLR